MPGSEGDAYRIVAFGDSTTATRSTIDSVYSDRLAGMLARAGTEVEIVNAGVGKNDTELARERFERDVLVHRPGLVIIQFGINDSAMDLSLGSREPRVPLDRFADNLRYFVRSLTEAGATVVIMTPNPLRWNPQTKELYGAAPYDPGHVRGFNLTLDPYVETVRIVAAEGILPLVDVNALFEAYDQGEGQTVDDLLLDGMHPNDEGHRVIAASLYPVVAGAIHAHS